MIEIKKILAAGWFPLVAVALPIVSWAKGLVPCDGIEDCSYGEFIRLIDGLIKFLAIDIGIPLATLAIVYAGILYVINPANPGAMGTAKKIFWAAVKGLVIALAAYLIVKFIVYGLGADKIIKVFE